MALHNAGLGLQTEVYQYVVDVTFTEACEVRQYRLLAKSPAEAQNEAYSCWPNEVGTVKVTPATLFSVEDLQAIEVL